ncbi:hypothetical protein GLOIN_2v1781358 [Rhizophagus irregularis DAOM 181602=DAOM 197198]|nr:hypothetical protein GLOIN_2v1781358 [Rhizophagus irregularis DAOM 181602=DAOM 197198]
MDIDIVRLENTKDLLALDGREAAEELGLDIDKSITHNISGAPGSGRTFGMHREIGLSRTCLKRYNYDVHESREHIAFTCNEKNVFIPIVSDVNRGDKK